MNQEHSQELEGLLFLLRESGNFVTLIVQNPQKYFLRTFSSDPELMNAVKKAWEEASVALDETIEKIGNELSPVRDEHSKLTIELHRVGFTGIQLKLKMILFRKLRRNFQKSEEPRWLKRMLGHIDSIFGSLSSVLPGIEAVSEVKEAVEKMISLRWGRDKSR